MHYHFTQCYTNNQLQNNPYKSNIFPVYNKTSASPLSPRPLVPSPPHVAPRDIFLIKRHLGRAANPARSIVALAVMIMWLHLYVMCGAFVFVPRTICVAAERITLLLLKW